MKKKLLVATIASLIGGTAMAQSAFEGFYGQVGVGYENASPKLSNQSITIPSIQAAPFNYSSTSNNANSMVGVFTLGYNKNITNEFVMGVGAEYEPFAGSSGSYTITNPTLGTGTGYYQKKSSYNIFISPGYSIDKEKLLYAKVGFTGAQALSDGVDTTNYTGYSLGLGYKQIISGGLYGFAEGNYASYGNKTTNSSGLTESGNAYTSTATSSFNVYNLVVGIGYKF